MLADLVNRNDMGMIEVGTGTRLETESPQVVFGRQVASTDHFERDLPVE